MTDAPPSRSSTSRSSTHRSRPRSRPASPRCWRRAPSSADPDALELLLRAAGVSPGSEVVLPANSFIATAEAALPAGCQPRLGDCDPALLLIDTEQTIAAVGPATGAVMALDLHGRVAPFEDLEGLGVPVLEDAAQSQGATRHRRPVAEAAADRILSLPIHPWITASQQETVAETLTKAVG